MAAKSLVLPLLVLSALHPLGSPASASLVSPQLHAARHAPTTARGIAGFSARSRASGIAAPQSVPDGAGGHYVMWADARDGDLDLFLLRVTNTGAPASGWPGDGLVVCNAPGDQAEGALFPDGANGVIVGWLDARDEAFFVDIYAQRVNVSGVAQWAANGVKVLEGSPLISDPAGAPDGTGGVLVAWSQGGVFPNDIYAVRITGAGTVAPGWDPGGEVVCNDPDDQSNVVITNDGAGGAVVAWQDLRNSETHVYAQRMDASGAPQWTANGVQIDPAGHNAFGATLCPAAAGHTLVFWGWNGAAYGQRIDGTGGKQWAADGVTLYPGGGDGQPDGDLLAVPDGAGGAIVAWAASGTSVQGAQAQRVDGTGAVQWGSTGASIVSLASGFPDALDVVPDGGGGAYFAWVDFRGAGPDVYAQHVTPAGAPDWVANGLATCTAAFEQRGAAIAPDGAGGVLVSWLDHRSLDTEPYAQRLSSAGVPQFAANGIPSFTNPGVQAGPLAVQTADGGALVVWTEKRGAQHDIRARKLDENGNPAGPAVPVAFGPAHQVAVALIEDGSGGGIVAWVQQNENDPNLHAQRLDGNAATLWTPNGVAVCTASGFQGNPHLVSDGAGGAIFAWYDVRAPGNPDIYAQRLNAAGAPQWGVNGTAVCADPGAQSEPRIASDGSGGAIIAWGDFRVGAPVVYAQRVSAAGTPQWAANGVEIGDFSALFTFPEVRGIVPHGGAGAIVLINEYSFEPVTFALTNALRVQLVDGTGAPQWGTTGTTIRALPSRVAFEQVIEDGANGAYVVWSDDSGGVYDIYAQHVDGNGDVSWSLNGSVVCNATSYQNLGGITRSGSDIFVTWADRRSGQADVYAQRVNASGGGVWTANGVVVSDAARGQFGAGLAPWKSATPERLYVGWTDNRAGTERLAYIERLDFAGVSQWTADGVTSTEVALASAEADAERVRLVWYSTEQVMATVYRRMGRSSWAAIGTAVTDGAGRIAFEDRDVVPDARYGYRLGIVEGASEVFRGEVWVDVPAVIALGLEGLRPSPAVGDVVVSFTLPGGESARLEWLDLAGRLVRTDDLSGLAPGRHAVRLGGASVAPGVYVLRLTQGGHAVTARGVVMR